MPDSSFFNPSQFAQEFSKKVTPKDWSLTGSDIPIRKTPDSFPIPNSRQEEYIFPLGPASSLPVKDFDELYPKQVPIDLNETAFFLNSDNDSRMSPFNREFDFTETDRTNDYKETASVNERSKRFLNQYFSGKNPEPVINPATGRPYGNELKIHDAMHDFANVGNTLRGEELITIAENIGASPLSAKNIGLNQLTQQIPYDTNAFNIYDKAYDDALLQARMGGRTLVQQRGAARGSSLFRDANNVASFLSPPISQEEFNTMAQRGQEFYDQVHQNWNQFKREGDVEFSDELTYEGKKIRDAASSKFLGNDLRKSIMENDYNPPALAQRIEGGYNKGGIPYGNYLSLMNAPLVPTVNKELWSSELNKNIESLVPDIQNKIEKEKQIFTSPEQNALRIAAQTEFDNWENKANALRNNPSTPAVNLLSSRLERLIGPRPENPAFQSPGSVTSLIRSFTDDFHSIRKDQLPTSELFDKINTPKQIKKAINTAVDSKRNIPELGGTGRTAAVSDNINNDRFYLNPANLGANAFRRKDNYFSQGSADLGNLLLETAAKAKQIEGYNKALPAVKRAIKTGFNTATDITGSVPLFDPEFRQAVHQGNVREAAKRVATEYATGAVTAPVVGMGLGVLNRTAPRAALAVAGALNASRVANPVAVVSQLGGSSKMTPQQEIYEQQLRNTKIQQAEAARKRGGKWKFPTPFGQITIPELGISEAKGLFFR